MDSLLNSNKKSMIDTNNDICVKILLFVFPKRDNFPVGYSFQVSSKDFIS